jgi:hypothetical protein
MWPADRSSTHPIRSELPFQRTSARRPAPSRDRQLACPHCRLPRHAMHIFIPDLHEDAAARRQQVPHGGEAITQIDQIGVMPCFHGAAAGEIQWIMRSGTAESTILKHSGVASFHPWFHCRQLWAFAFCLSSSPVLQAAKETTFQEFLLKCQVVEPIWMNENQQGHSSAVHKDGLQLIDLTSKSRNPS